MKPFEIEIKITLARREMQYWQDILAKKSCKDCENFPTGVCKIAMCTPPVDVQKVGCPQWAWDTIPF